MRKTYIGCKIVNAEPMLSPDSKPGYNVYYPDGYASWSPEAVFEAAYREVSNHERQVINQTDAEASIAAISDGDPETAPPECPGSDNGRHSWVNDEEEDVAKCRHCPEISQRRSLSPPDQLG